MENLSKSAVFESSSAKKEKQKVDNKLSVHDLPENHFQYDSQLLGIDSNQPSSPVQKKAESKEEELQMKKESVPKQSKEEDEKKTQLKPGDAYPHLTASKAIQTKMPEQVQAKMEQSFGTDFSSVNIHKDSSSATQMGAQAYAQGNDVHFAPGKYNPNTQGGQELLGHELTHVVQQRQGRVSGAQNKDGANINADPSLENEADEMGRKAAKGEPAKVNGKGSGLQRKSIRFSDDAAIEDINNKKKYLNIGSSGIVVRKIQQALADAGFLTADKVTGSYDTDTKDAVISFQKSSGLTGKDVDGIVGPTTMGLLSTKFSDYAVEANLAKGAKPGNLLAGTRNVDATDKKAIADIISTEVKANPVTGKLPTFKKITVKGDYEKRVKSRVEQVLLAQYNHYGKGKAKDRKDSSKMHKWSDIEKVAVESKKETDKVFGAYKTGPALKANINIKDGWDDKEAKLSGSKKLQDASAEWRVRKIVQGDRGVRIIDQEHGAVQSRAAEKKILDGIKKQLVSKYYNELIETHKGWPGYASGGKIFLQRYKSPTVAANRDYMWQKFRTIIHEYIHTLEHADHVSYRGGMGDKKGGKTLREGVVDYFTKTVWNNANLKDLTLRKTIEGPFHDPLNPLGHPMPSMGVYAEAANAERLAGLVGFKNVCAAFFLGKTKYIGS